MPARVATTSMLKHARYLSWRSHAVAAANRRWEGDPCDPRGLMTGKALDAHLLCWAVATGLLEDAHPKPRQSTSAYLAGVFAGHREAVIEEARDYWRGLQGRP